MSKGKTFEFGRTLKRSSGELKRSGMLLVRLEDDVYVSSSVDGPHESLVLPALKWCWPMRWLLICLGSDFINNYFY